MDTSLIALADYAAQHNITPATMRQRIARGLHTEAVKMAGVWLIPRDAPYRPDGRNKKSPRR